MCVVLKGMYHLNACIHICEHYTDAVKSRIFLNITLWSGESELMFQRSTLPPSIGKMQKTVKREKL
jgi:hypothetical protein